MPYLEQWILLGGGERDVIGDFRCLSSPYFLNWLTGRCIVCFTILYNIYIIFIWEVIHHKCKFFKRIRKKDLEARIHNTLEEFCYRGEEWNGVMAGGGWGNFSHFIWEELSSERWSVSPRLTQLAWLGWEWHPGPWPPAQCPFLPHSCCLFLVVIIRVLGYWPSGWFSYSYGNSAIQSLGAGGTSATSWHTWPNLPVTCLLLWYETSFQTCARSCISSLLRMLTFVQGPRD